MKQAVAVRSEFSTPTLLAVNEEIAEWNQLEHINIARNSFPHFQQKQIDFANKIMF